MLASETDFINHLTGRLAGILCCSLNLARQTKARERERREMSVNREMNIEPLPAAALTERQLIVLTSIKMFGSPVKCR